MIMMITKMVMMSEVEEVDPLIKWELEMIGLIVFEKSQYNLYVR